MPARWPLEAMAVMVSEPEIESSTMTNAAILNGLVEAGARRARRARHDRPNHSDHRTRRGRCLLIIRDVEMLTRPLGGMLMVRPCPAARGALSFFPCVPFPCNLTYVL